MGMVEKLSEYEAIVASGEIGAMTRKCVASLLGAASREIARLRDTRGALADSVEEFARADDFVADHGWGAATPAGELIDGIWDDAKAKMCKIAFEINDEGGEV